MSNIESQWAAIEIRKARLRLAISAYTNELVMFEVLAAGGGVMKSMELAERMSGHFKGVEQDPRLLCKAMGFAVDEVVDIARFLS